MLLHLETETGEIQDATGIETQHPQLALAEMPARRRADDVVTGKTWAIVHIRTGTVVMAGLITKDLAFAAVAFLSELGLKFESERESMPQAFALFQAAANLMADTYLSALYPAEKGQVAHA